jgi:hypothetical protein
MGIMVPGLLKASIFFLCGSCLASSGWAALVARPIPEAASLVPAACLVIAATAFEARRRRRRPKV